MSELKKCPFCGGEPLWNYLGWQDECRYVSMELQCCVTMSEGIGWRTARAMTETAIIKKLKDNLAAKWNQRYTDEE